MRLPQHVRSVMPIKGLGGFQTSKKWDVKLYSVGTVATEAIDSAKKWADATLTSTEADHDIGIVIVKNESPSNFYCVSILWWSLGVELRREWALTPKDALNRHHICLDGMGSVEEIRIADYERRAWEILVLDKLRKNEMPSIDKYLRDQFSSVEG